MPYRKIAVHTAAGTREIAGTPLTETPEAPVWMGEVARRKFVEVCEYLIDSGSLTAGELGLVEMYSAAYGKWWQAEEALAAGDPGWRVVVSRGGTEGSPVMTPMMAQSMRSMEALRKLGAALGLAPTERSRLPGKRPVGEPDPMDELLARGGY